MEIDRLKALPKRYGAYALVTGASEGIGRSFAEELAKVGMNVVLVARRQDRLNALAKSLEAKYPILCPVIAADLSSTEQLEGLLLITDELDIGLVVCNAGFGTAGNFLDSDLEVEMNMLSLNVAAVTQLVHHFGQKFKRKGAGGVILLSSIVATQGVARSAQYAASKAYVHTLGEGLQQEWRGSGLDLLIVAPGPVKTGFAQRSKMELGKTASPEVVAQQSLQALGRQKLVHPGWLAKCMALALSTAPRFLRVKIMSAIMGSMTQRLPH
jgi:short-subunit dehydrogenase